MSEHRYQQYCALARALDVVGNRWTLLIVRELLPGPRRFTDLVEGLPGISRKLLTERLRDLEREGLIARTELPPPAARQVYELTQDGRDLWVAVNSLVRWGSRRLGERGTDEGFRARWAAIGMASLGNREETKGIREKYQYFVGDSAFYLSVDDGSIEVHDGRADDPAVVVTTDEDTWADVASGRTRASAAIAAGTLTVTGDPKAQERLGKIFSRRRMLSGALHGAA